MIGKTFIRNDRVVNTKKFREKCPTAYKNLGGAIRLYKVMLKIGSAACCMDDPDKENQFCTTYTDMTRRYIESYYTDLEPRTLSHYLFALLKHGMIVKVKDEDVNDDLYRLIKNYQNNKEHDGHYYHASVFHIPILSKEKMKEIEEAGKEWKSNGYTLTGASFNTLLQAEGMELCKDLFPQYSKDIAGERTTSKAFDNSFKRTEEYVKEKIKENGYCFERDLSDNLVLDKRSIKKFIPGLIKSLNIKEVRTNKGWIEMFDLDVSGYPILLVPQDLNLDK